MVQEERYRELLDAYSDAMDGMALLKAKMSASAGAEPTGACNPVKQSWLVSQSVSYPWSLTHSQSC